MRKYDKLNKRELSFKNTVIENRNMGFGRMIQIIQYIWTDCLINDYDMEEEAAKKGSGETNWTLNGLLDGEKRIEELEEKIEDLETHLLERG